MSFEVMHGGGENVDPMSRCNRIYYLDLKTCSLFKVNSFFSFFSLALGQFLDAFSHLYKRVCPSVGPSVSQSHTS